MDTLICISTDQSLANLIPVLQHRPKKIVLIATQSFKEKAKAFGELVRQTLRASEGTPPSVEILTGCPDSGIADITAFVQQKLIPRIADWPGVAVNLTGGTKLHSFVLHQCLQDRVADAFYVDTRGRHVEHYPLGGQAPRVEPLPSVLNIEQSLRGMGKKRLRAESDHAAWVDAVQARAPLTQWMAEHVSPLQPMIGSLNTLISGFYRDRSLYLRPASLELFQHPKGEGLQLLEKAHDLGLMQWHGGKKIEFQSYAQARYLAGNWLEEYAWLCAVPLGFEQLACNIEFSNQVADPKNPTASNEMDLMVVHANAMLAVECKSATAAAKEAASQDMFHKLSAVANRAGGLMCSKLFLSAFPLSYKNGTDLASLHHAKEQSIVILDGENLLKLPEFLMQWRDTSRLPRSPR